MVMAELETLLKTPFGDYQLQRYPALKKETLRAWDAADEYVLRYLDENNLAQEKTSLLIFNDNSGGLSIPLNSFSPVVVTDSYLSMQAISANAESNQIDAQAITVIDSLLTPEAIEKPL